jgi:hypothetical protein
VHVGYASKRQEAKVVELSVVRNGKTRELEQTTYRQRVLQLYHQ